MPRSSTSATRSASTRSATARSCCGLALPWLPVGVHVGGRRPGRRHARGGRSACGRPVATSSIGPDNGLLTPRPRRLGGVSRGAAPREPGLAPAARSARRSTGATSSRPLAAHLAAAARSDVGPADRPGERLCYSPARGRRREGPADRVIYEDTFGNLKLAGRRPTCDAALGIGSGAALVRGRAPR